MCEPNHSIVQYPDHDPDRDDRPTGGLIDAIPGEHTTKDGWWSWVWVIRKRLEL